MKCPRQNKWRICSLGKKQLLVRASAEYLRSPVAEAKPYRNFFNSLEKAMFLEAHRVD